jgi:DNA repair ATPase RecN
MKLSSLHRFTISEAVAGKPQALITMNHQDYTKFVELLKAIYHEMPDFADLTRQTQSGSLASVNAVLQKSGVQGGVPAIVKELSTFVNNLKQKFTTERGVWDQVRENANAVQDVQILIRDFSDIYRNLAALRELVMKYQKQFDPYEVFADFTRLMKTIEKTVSQLKELSHQVSPAPQQQRQVPQQQAKPRGNPFAF